MRKNWKTMLTPFVTLGAAAIFLVSGCTSEGTDTDTTGTTTTVASVAANTATYKAAGYRTFATECYQEGSLGGTDLYKQNYLFIKDTTTASPIAGRTGGGTSAVLQSAPNDASADFDLKMVNYTLLECSSQPLITQTISALADLTADSQNVVETDNSIESMKDLRIHISDVTITPGSAAVVYSFLTSTNRDLSNDLGDDYNILNKDSSWSANGFCGLMTWSVGKASNPMLPGEIPSGDTTADSGKDLIYAMKGGLGSCALAPVGDTSMDVSYLLSQAYGIATAKMFVIDTIGFNTTEASDLSTNDATNDRFFWDELTTIWLTGLGDLGLGTYDAGGVGAGSVKNIDLGMQPSAHYLGDTRYKYVKQ
ncbi:hypothetical protein KJ966_16740 [bacterium]|nr:hypothetical protein [bacterium]